jgi:GT2 family glycosyltransferase
MKDVSVIMPVKNDVENVRSSINSILKQKPSEIIIIDGASKDGTVESIKDMPVKIIVEPRPGGALARNIGIKKSKGEILLFTDSDCVACPNWIKNHLEALKKYDVVMGKIVLHKGWRNSIIAKSLEYGLLPYFDFPFLDKNVETLPFWNLYTSNLSLKRSVLKNVGLMDEDFKLVGSEDTEFGYRISKKYKIGYAPDAIIYHKHKKSFRSAMKRAVIAGRQSAFLKTKTQQKNRRGILFLRLRKLFGFKDISLSDKAGILFFSFVFLLGFFYGYLTYKKLYNT